MPEPRVLFDFSDPAHVRMWSPVNDAVMGGRSEGRRAEVRGAMRFSGNISFANHGGFASLRTAFGQWNLAAGAALILRVRGDGKTYKLSLRTERRFDALAYQARFSAPAGGWKDQELPLDLFRATYHGRELTRIPPLDPHTVTCFGLLIADRQEGPFWMELAKLSLKLR